MAHLSTRLRWAVTLALAGVVGCATSLSQAPSDHQWSSFARDAQHTALSPWPTGAQLLNRVIWSTPVDLDPQFNYDVLAIHYGSPLITAADTVIVPVKTGAAGGFRVDALRAADGSLIWSGQTDYILPPHYWTPEFGPALASLPQPRVYFPGAGGTVYFRNQPNSVCAGSHACQGQLAFYGLKEYQSDPTAYDAGIEIDTPLTADPEGSIYFGFFVNPGVSGVS